ncbi:MAG: F0F1 ATP synthase subunit A [Alphaproteobacteria bacterium]|nr:MAG: F0F1 ATP synthase subunit A [Alphaproteobacteria bacterium]
MNQFKIVAILPIKFFGLDLSFTNASLFMMLASVIFIALAFAQKYLILPGFIQFANERIYTFINDISIHYLGKESDRYTPFLIALFVFVLFGNLLGLVPHSFTFTSHLSANLVIALSVFGLSIFVGYKKHGTRFLRLFVPSGVPTVIKPLIFVIELALFFIKPLVMALRLSVNMIAGHVVLKVILGYAVTLLYLKFIPIVGYATMILFEMAVAFFQAYIFVLLSCISLKDVLYLH